MIISRLEVYIVRKPLLGSCPVCHSELVVTRLECKKCNTYIGGQFELCPLCRLEQSDREFVLTFIKCRGSIKDVEKELGISYPTVKNRLNAVIEALGFAVEDENRVDRMAVLEEIEKGTISAKDGIEILRKGDHKDDR